MEPPLPQEQMMSHGLFELYQNCNLVRFQGWLVQSTSSFAVLEELVLVNRVFQTGRGNCIPVKTSQLKWHRREAVWVFETSCFDCGWSLCPLSVAKEFNQHFTTKLRWILGFQNLNNDLNIDLFYEGSSMVPKASTQSLFMPPQKCYALFCVWILYHV